MQIAKVLSSETRRCPYCGAEHDVKIVECQMTLFAPGAMSIVPMQFFWCEPEDVFYTDLEMDRINRGG